MFYANRGPNITSPGVLIKEGLLRLIRESYRSDKIYRKSNVMVSLAFVYRDLTDEELESAIKFYEAPAGKWYNETHIRAITSAIGKASREIGEKAGKSLMAKEIPI